MISGVDAVVPGWVGEWVWVGEHWGELVSKQGSREGGAVGLESWVLEDAEHAISVFWSRPLIITRWSVPPRASRHTSNHDVAGNQWSLGYKMCKTPGSLNIQGRPKEHPGKHIKPLKPVATGIQYV